MPGRPVCCGWRPSRRPSCSRPRIASAPPAQRRRSARAPAPPSSLIGQTMSATRPPRCAHAGCRYIVCPSAASGCTRDSTQYRTCPRKSRRGPGSWAGAAARSPEPVCKWQGSPARFAQLSPWARRGALSRRCGPGGRHGGAASPQPALLPALRIGRRTLRHG